MNVFMKNKIMLGYVLSKTYGSSFSLMGPKEVVPYPLTKEVELPPKEVG